MNQIILKIIVILSLLLSGLNASQLDEKATKINTNELINKVVEVATPSNLSIADKKKQKLYFKNYKGTIIDWNLTVSHISGNPGAYWLTTADGNFKTRIKFSTTSKKRINVIESLVNGDKVNVKGILDGKCWSSGLNIPTAKLISVNGKII